MSHARWKSLRERQLTEGYAESADVAEARREIRLSMALAKAVYDRRTELGLTQAELAERAGLTQAKISRIEGSDTVPTLPLLAKLADALDATLNIALDADDTRVTSPATTPTQPEYGAATRADLVKSNESLPMGSRLATAAFSAVAQDLPVVIAVSVSGLEIPDVAEADAVAML